MLIEDQVLKVLLKREWRTCAEQAALLGLPVNEKSPSRVLLKVLLKGLVGLGKVEKRIRLRTGQGKGRGRDEFRKVGN